MASLPIPVAVDASETFGAQVEDSILLIPTRDIQRGERLRDIDPVWAGALGQLMARDGQQTPIEVCRLPGRSDWLLVAGGHRHEGAILEELPFLRAVVVSANRDDRRLREINENLWRKDLEPIDRAAFIAEAVLIQKRRAGIADAHRAASVPTRLKALDAEAADTLETISNVYGWSEEVGAQLGFTGRTIRNDLYVYRRLAPSIVARLRGGRHPVARNATQLRALAKLEDRVQRDVVNALLGEAGWQPCRTVAEGVKRTQPATARTAASAESKNWNAAIGALSRMGASERLALFQSRAFHDLIPAEARALLAPMLRTGDAR